MCEKLDGVYETAIKVLAKKLRGYYVREKKTIYAVNASGEKVLKDETVQTKYIPPDLSAIMFVLTNRAPLLWRQKPGDKPEEIADDGVDLSKLSEGALREIAGL